MSEAIIKELKEAEKRYRDNKTLDEHGIIADAFKIAIEKLQKRGLRETYRFFKIKRDEMSGRKNPLSKRMAHSYGLVINKLWKYTVKPKNINTIYEKPI